MPFGQAKTSYPDRSFILKKDLAGLLLRSAEAKYVDFSQSLDLTVAASKGIDLSVIVQGTDQEQRIGNAIQVTGLLVKCLYRSDNGSTQASHIRVVLYESYIVGAAALDVQPYEQIDPESFRVYMDVIKPVDWTATLTEQLLSFKKSWKPYKAMIWDDNLSTTVRKGQLRLMVSTDHIAVGDIHGNLLARLFYRDV